MVSNIIEKEVKNLIKKGFDLELISFELDIPLEELEQYKLELEREQKSNKIYNAKEIIDKENNLAYLKMEQMKKMYSKLIFYSYEEGCKQSQIQENRKVEIAYIMKKIQIITEKMKTMSRDKRLKEARKIVQNIDIAQYQTEDIEELKKLEKLLKSPILQRNPITAGTSIKVKNKINKIKQQEAINRIKKETTRDIELIIIELAKGTLDVEKAMQIIEQEAHKRVESKPKNKFTLTEEQEKRQIIFKIQKVLKEKTEQYYIENPETTIIKLSELNNGEIEQSIGTVVKNLERKKDFGRAKEICDKFLHKKEAKTLPKYINGLKKEIQNAEVGDMVLKVINTETTYEEEIMCFNLIEKGLRCGNINLRAISLGRSQDGKKTITLADIWPDENIYGREF